MRKHHAPSVEYPVGRSPWLARLLAALVGWMLLSALACAVLPPLMGQGGLRHAWLLLPACLVACAGVRSFWRGQSPRCLAWDGGHWLLRQGAGQAADGAVQVVLDVQRALLLRFEPSLAAPHRRARRCWLWADAAMQPDRWHALRCALYSVPHAKSVGQPFAGR